MSRWVEVVLLGAALALPGCAAVNRRLPEHSETLPPKDPGLAAAASFIVPGLGEVYVGHVRDGYVTFVRQAVVFPAIVFLGYMLSAYQTSLPTGEVSRPGQMFGFLLMGAGGVIGFAGHTMAVNAAYEAAEAYNQRLVVLRGQAK